mmetsp:Transcript_31125/g.57512  ORF Transcript_31125/g.57512 Transcript_31125/m.57512 type:complete len:244 (-) Transcript_31125:224-955(-)|eukprot:CAMPEP_0197454156 /NCGR_PEP_ID=MMETSP1175-20131217/37079_1 /TAXON_ID=1003142 /ORGANISM="Triceratium dubium, Strain CCMP147" /LENGTH=243 /DNA_ID=CAMNT_0042987659 /DNA_START=535 /DNA_END=1266 /DNA_ORIENTATION=+
MASNNSTGSNSSNGTSRRPFVNGITILLPAIIGTAFSIVAVASCHFLSVPVLLLRTPDIGLFRADNGFGCAAYTRLDEWLTDSTPPTLRAARAFGVIAAALSGTILLALVFLLCVKTTAKKSSRRTLQCLASGLYFFAFVSQLLALLLFVRSVEDSCRSDANCPVRLGSGAALSVVSAVLFVLLGVFLCTCGIPPDEIMVLGRGKSQRQHAVGPDQKQAGVSQMEESAPTAKPPSGDTAEYNV